MIDIGVNLTNTRFDKDRVEVIKRAKLANIEAMLVTGTNIAESQLALKLCQENPAFLSSTAGVHPHDADNVSDKYLEELRALACHKHVKAIGECGLDFNRNFSMPVNQQRVFSEQVELASEVKLPLFLHQRDAFDTWLAVLLPYISKVPAMITHCFTGNLSQLNQCLEHGMYIGITGWVCDERRGQALRDIIKHIPLNRLLIETDAPYLTPRNIRPKPKSSRNEPSYLSYVVDVIAKEMNCDAEGNKQNTVHQMPKKYLIWNSDEFTGSSYLFDTFMLGGLFSISSFLLVKYYFYRQKDSFYLACFAFSQTLIHFAFVNLNNIIKVLQWINVDVVILGLFLSSTLFLLLFFNVLFSIVYLYT